MLLTLRENKIAAILLLAAFVCAVSLCAVRARLEAANGEALVIMTAEDLSMLDGTPDAVRAFDGAVAIDGALLLIEDENQYSFTPVAGVETGGLTWGAGSGTEAVRCFKLIDKYASRYGILGYDGAEEIENILYRALTDRNIRVLWLTPFIDGRNGEMVTDAAVYDELIENLTGRVSPHGIELGTSFSTFPAYEPAAPLFIGAALGVLCAAYLLLAAVLRRKKYLYIAFAPMALGAAALCLVIPGPAIPALAASIVFPCLSICCVADILNAPPPDGLAAAIGKFALALAIGLFVALMGGVFIGALQSDTAYLLAVHNFRGVKLSQLAPVLFAVFIVFKTLYGIDETRRVFSGRRTWVFIASAALLGLVAVFLMRTGDGMLGVSGMEQRFRNALEAVLIVRPRTKEFLAAWPCLALAFALAALRQKNYVWPFAIVPVIGFSSVVNTFCHSRSPLWLSATRSALGAVIGFAIGLVILCVSWVLKDKIRPKETAGGLRR